jgi:membrane protein implicated in regulation of membrane protease activity
VPLSIVLMVLLLTFGAIGFATNVIAREYFRAAWQPIVVSLPLALIGSVAITGAVARGIGRFAPLNESSAHRRHELLGAVGEAVFAIDDQTGVVSIRDRSNNLLQVACRVGAGRERIPKGSRVKLVAYHAPMNVFVGVEHNSTTAGAAHAPAHAK